MAPERAGARGGQQRAEFAYVQLRDAIHNGQLHPGERIRETDLAGWLNVSRTPIREALRRLESEGLATRAPRRGLIVTELDPQQILELYALRETLEGMAAGLAARYASDHEIASMRQLLALQKAAGNHAAELAVLNRRFHEALYQAGRNRYLLQALGSLRDALALLRETTYAVPGRPAEALAEHRRIVDAVRRQDAVGADEAARRHIRSAANARLALVLNAGNPMGQPPLPLPVTAASKGGATRRRPRPPRAAPAARRRARRGG